MSEIISSDYAENGKTPVATYAVADAGDSTITWSLSGDDSGDFSISSAGVFSFSAHPYYESPAEANTDEEAGSECNHTVSLTRELMSEEMIPL